MKIIIDAVQDWALVFWKGNLSPYVIASVEHNKRFAIGDEIQSWHSGAYFCDLASAVEAFEILVGRKTEPNENWVIAKAFVDTLLNEISDYEDLNLDGDELGAIYEQCMPYRDQDSIETTMNRWLMTHGYEYNDDAKYVKKD